MADSWRNKIGSTLVSSDNGLIEVQRLNGWNGLNNLIEPEGLWIAVNSPRRSKSRSADFCKALDVKLPAYCFIPLTTDEMRIKVMQSRLFNEIRAGEIFGGWLKSTPELDVKKTLAEATHEEYEHAVFLEEALRSKGATPYDYQPLPAQMAMFNAFEGLTDTVERIAAFPMAGEGVADYLIAKSLKAGTVPSWVTAPYQKNPRRRRRAWQLPV